MRRHLFHVSLILLLLAGILGATLPASSAPTSQASPTTTIRVISSDQGGITLELVVNDVIVEPVVLAGHQYDALTISDCTPATDSGCPALPRKHVLLGVPPGADLRVSAEVLEAEMLPDRYRVAPAPRWVTHEEDGVQRLEPVYDLDVVTYTSSAPYPTELVRLVSIGYVRSQRVASLELAPVQIRPATGELRLIRWLRVRLDFAYPDAAAERQSMEHAEETSFEGILSRSLLNYETARSWRAAPSRSLSPTLSPSSHWTPPEPAWKVLVNETGLYHLTYAYLLAAGLPVDTLDPRTFKLYNQGAEIACYVTGQEDGRFDSGDYVEFYGQALDTLYTDTNVYWLAYGGLVGMRMGTRNGNPDSAPTPAVFTTTAQIKESHFYWSSVPTGDNHWFWQRMYAISPTHSITHPLTAVFTGTLGLITNTPTCIVGVSFYGATYNNAVEPDHHAIVYLNDYPVIDAWWDGQTPYSTTVEVPSTYLTDITNTFRVDMPADTGSSYDCIYVDGFSVEYPHPYRALEDKLAFTQDMTGTWQYRLTDFSESDILILDVTDPARLVRITGSVPWDGYRSFLPLVGKSDVSSAIAGASVSANGTSHLVRFQDTVDDPTNYLVLSASQTRQPLAITPDTPSHLSDITNQADYVIIAYDDFAASAQPLSTYWQSQSLNTMLIPVSDVYDEFSYGVFDPTAIRDFLAYAYANWQFPQLAYVLLVGDGTYDYRNFQGFNLSPGIPTYLVDSPYTGETGSDNWYVCVSGKDYLPDLHIGRLPASNAAEATLMVNKILDYAQNPPAGTWKQDVLFVADNADSGGDFRYYSDLLVNGYLPSAYTPVKVYYKVTHMNQPATTYAITNTVNNGCLLVNYIGHGAIYLWANEKLLYCKAPRCDFDSLNNGSKLPFVASMTCMDGHYIHPDPVFTALAERWLLRDGGGAVATFASTDYGLASGHDYMNRGLFTAIFTDTMALGPATTASKLYLYAQTGDSYRDLIETYHLFGDPALSLHLP